MGSFVIPVYPVVGQPTRRTFAQVVIDDLIYLNGLANLTKGFGLINGSFEQNTGANTAPSNWDLTLAAGNSCLIEVLAANVRHGKQSFKMTTPGNVPGGVGIVTADFYEIGEAQTIFLSWFMKSTAAGIRNQVNVLWYDINKTLLSTAAALDSVANSITWVHLGANMTAPAGARFFKVQLLGVNNLVAGSVWFDGATYEIAVSKFQSYGVAGTFTWIAPISGTVEVEEWGAGGGACGSSGLSPVKGGGSGAYQKYWIAVAAGTAYTVVIGAGGAGGPGGTTNPGATGGDTYFASITYIAKGGAGATSAAVGAGGAAQANTFGQAGNAGTAPAGAIPPFLIGTPGRPATGNGAGGSPGSPDQAGGTGAPGLLILKVLG